jgi:hypothetical protein
MPCHGCHTHTQTTDWIWERDLSWTDWAGPCNIPSGLFQGVQWCCSWQRETVRLIYPAMGASQPGLGSGLARNVIGERGLAGNVGFLLWLLLLLLLRTAC